MLSYDHVDSVTRRHSRSGVEAVMLRIATEAVARYSGDRTKRAIRLDSMDVAFGGANDDYHQDAIQAKTVCQALTDFARVPLARSQLARMSYT